MLTPDAFAENHKKKGTKWKNIANTMIRNIIPTKPTVNVIKQTFLLVTNYEK